MITNNPAKKCKVLCLEIFIVNDIRNFVFGLAKVHIYGFCEAGNRNLLCRLL